MLIFIVKFICLVGLPLFFVVGFLCPLLVAWFHPYMDPELREMKRAHRAAMLKKSAGKPSSTSGSQAKNKIK